MVKQGDLSKKERTVWPQKRLKAKKEMLNAKIPGPRGEKEWNH